MSNDLDDRILDVLGVGIGTSERGATGPVTPSVDGNMSVVRACFPWQRFRHWNLQGEQDGLQRVKLGLT